jgi:hypothetical protein
VELRWQRVLEEDIQIGLIDPTKAKGRGSDRPLEPMP